MPLKTDGDLAVVSLILTKEQVYRLRERARTQSSPMRKVTLAEVGREVVEAGLHVLSFAPRSSFMASNEDSGERVA